MKRKAGSDDMHDSGYGDFQKDGLLNRMTAFSYGEPLSDNMVRDVYCCRPQDTVRRIAGEMAMRKISSVVVTDEDMRPVGIVTERDIVRKVVAGDFCGSPDITIADIMTPAPVCLSHDDTLFDALSILQKHSIKHLPVTEAGRVTGMLSMRQILKARHAEPLMIIGRLHEAKNSSDFRSIRDEMVSIVRDKLTSHTDPADIVSMLSLVNRSIQRRLLRTALDKQGPAPPVDFCFFVTGSLGRMESLLLPDQDFCLITDDYDDTFRTEYDEYFTGVSQKFADLMNDAGFPYCPGKVMAQNPDWRKSISAWRTFITRCFDRTGDFTVRYMTLIFDSHSLYGSTPLFNSYINHAYDELSRNHNVLRMMHDDEEGKHRVPLGWFNKFITETEKDHKGEIDMKRSGLIFIIEAARILAMKHGIRETSTMKRLRALVRKGAINAEDSEYFEDAYRVVLHHTLNAQSENLIDKGKADYYLRPGTLSHRNQEMLKEAFRAISRLQDIVGSEFGELIL